VVKGLSHLRVFGSIPLFIYHFLLFHQAGHFEGCFRRPLLRIYGDHLLLVFRPHRDDGIMHLFLVCASHLRISVGECLIFRQPGRGFHFWHFWDILG
jgi:hypothetical protein